VPTYLPPLHGISLSEAEAEAAAIAPIHRVALDALEFWHPAFTAPARVVNDNAPLTATLEADAPRDAGEAVTFQAVAVSVIWPSETDDAAAPRLQLQVDGVSAILIDQLELAVDTLDPVILIARRYMSDDLSGPARLPVLTLELTDVRVTETRVTATCLAGDPANTRFPSRAYTRARYPGLPAR
jgi:hypothetical protein